MTDQMRNMNERYTVEIFYSREDECFIGEVPAFEGLSCVADTRSAVLLEVESAIATFVGIYKERGWSIPTVDDYAGYEERHPRRAARPTR